MGHNKALAASMKGTSSARRQHRRCGQVRQPRQDRMQRRSAPEREAKAVEPTNRIADRGRRQAQRRLNGMKQKLVLLKSKRSELLARAKTAEAQNKVHDAVQVDRRPRPPERARSLRGQGATPGGARRRKAGTGRVDPRRAGSRASKTWAWLTEVGGAPGRAQGRRHARPRPRSTPPRRRKRPVRTTEPSGPAPPARRVPCCREYRGGAARERWLRDDEGMARFVIVPAVAGFTVLARDAAHRRGAGDRRRSAALVVHDRRDPPRGGEAVETGVHRFSALRQQPRTPRAGARSDRRAVYDHQAVVDGAGGRRRRARRGADPQLA